MIVRSKTDIPLQDKLSDGSTNKWVRAYVSKADGTAITTVNLVHKERGNYVALYNYAGDEKIISVDYVVFSDAYVTIDTSYEQQAEQIYFDDSAVAGDEMALEEATVTALEKLMHPTTVQDPDNHTLTMLDANDDEIAVFDTEDADGNPESDDIRRFTRRA